jgi:hypothetical protein
MPAQLKRCTKCGEVKDESEFKKYKRNNREYVRNLCKLCSNKYSTEWFKQLPPEKKQQYYKSAWNHKTCKIITEHHEQMKDDPEHLTTDFIQKVVGEKCE